MLLLVSLLSFGIIWLVPGDPAASFVDASASPEQLARLRHELGLDQPLWSQMLHWYGRILSGDLGQSILLNRSVTAALMERLPVTLSLAGLALVLAVVLGVAAGIVAAMRRGTRTDQAVMTLALAGLSVPDFWLGLVLIVTFAVGLGWLPVGRLRADHAERVGMAGHDGDARAHAGAGADGLHRPHDALGHARRAAPGLHANGRRQGPAAVSSCCATACPMR